MYIRRLVALFLLVLLLVACRRDAEPSPDIETATPSPEPTIGESPLSPPPTPTPPRPEQGDSPLPQPETSPIGTPASSVTTVVAAAREHLARELDVPTEDVRPVRAESVEWSDASLGCPEPGKAYAQVITPGYRIVLRVGEREYDLHTDRRTRNIVICEHRQEEESAAAVQYLAAELGISAEEIDVLSVARHEWPDTSLGCPEVGKSYTQVLTQGYLVNLSARGERYEVHTDLEGQIAVVCQSEP